jgi:hypothetical protein
METIPGFDKIAEMAWYPGKTFRASSVTLSRPCANEHEVFGKAAAVLTEANVLQLLNHLDTEIDKGAHLGRRMIARWMEGEEREALVVPGRK